MPSAESLVRKEQYVKRLYSYLDQYKRIFIVQVDNVGSNQLQCVRKALRNTCEVLMGKNTLLRLALRRYSAQNPEYEKLINALQGNVGLVFTNDDLVTVRDALLENRRPAPARPGSLAPVDVIVPAQNTGMEPTKTSFFQALNIQTKINRGAIEILQPVHLIHKGDKVGNSEATLLQMLDIKPFSYGLEIEWVFDNGSMFLPKVLDISQQDVIGFMNKSLANIAAISLAVGVPTRASVPHTLVNGFKQLVAVAVEAEYDLEAAKDLIYRLNHPDEFAAAAPAAAASGGGGGGGGAEEKPAEKEESEEESDDDMGFSLFD